jgi:hypothetical protein
MIMLRWLALLVLVVILAPRPVPPVHGNPPPVPLAAPQLGPWIDVWMGMDDKHNYVEDVAYNHRHDEYLVLWTTAQGTDTTDLWARRVGAGGSVRSWFNVATNPAHVVSTARAAYSPVQDHYLVVFVYQYSSADWDIYAIIVPGDGTAPSGLWIPISKDTDFQSEPAIVYNDKTDEFLVAWSNGRNLTGPNPEWTVQMQRRRASDGTPDGGIYIVPGGGMGVARSGPAVAYNRVRDQYLIAYIVEAAAPGDVGSIAASADLAQFGAERHVWDHTPQWHAFDALVGASGDGYLVAWNVSHLSPPPPSAALQNGYARHVSGAGVPLGTLSGIPITAATHPFDIRRVSDAAYAPGYGYLMGLGYAQSTGAESDTYAAFILPGAATAGAPFAIDVAATHAWGPVAACAPRGVCLLAETYRLNAPWSKSDIRARFLYLQRVYLPATLRAAG